MPVGRPEGMGGVNTTMATSSGLSFIQRLRFGTTESMKTTSAKKTSQIIQFAIAASVLSESSVRVCSMMTTGMTSVAAASTATSNRQAHRSRQSSTSGWFDAKPRQPREP